MALRAQYKIWKDNTTDPELIELADFAIAEIEQGRLESFFGGNPDETVSQLSGSSEITADTAFFVRMNNQLYAMARKETPVKVGDVNVTMADGRTQHLTINRVLIVSEVDHQLWRNIFALAIHQIVLQPNAKGTIQGTRQTKESDPETQLSYYKENKSPNMIDLIKQNLPAERIKILHEIAETFCEEAEIFLKDEINKENKEKESKIEKIKKIIHKYLVEWDNLEYDVLAGLHKHGAIQTQELVQDINNKDSKYIENMLDEILISKKPEMKIIQEVVSKLIVLFKTQTKSPQNGEEVNEQKSIEYFEIELIAYIVQAVGVNRSSGIEGNGTFTSETMA
ncbi:MAG: hypothetical protein WCF65_04090 [Parachlamydiaceae bacterium]